MKRGIYGNFHHISEPHLYRYLAEFDFRYNALLKLAADKRAVAALKQLIRETQDRLNHIDNSE